MATGIEELSEQIKKMEAMLQQLMQQAAPVQSVPVVAETTPVPLPRKGRSRTEKTALQMSAYAYTIKNKFLREKYIEQLIKRGLWRTQQS